MLKYEDYFKDIIRKLQYEFSYEDIIEQTSTLRNWSREIHFVPISLIFERPVYSYEFNYSLSINPKNFNSIPIIIYFNHNHFSGD